MKSLKFLFILVFCTLPFLVLYLLFAFVCAELNPFKWDMFVRAVFAFFILATLSNLGSFVQLLSGFFDDEFSK